MSEEQTTEQSSLLTPAMEQECFRRIATTGGATAKRAMTQMFRAYAPRFAAFLRMRGLSPAGADDVIQAVFLKLLEARHSLTDVRSPRAYLWRMLRNALVDHRRAIGSRPEDSINTDSARDAEEDSAGAQSWVQRLVGDQGVAAEHLDLAECIGRALEELRKANSEKAFVIELAALEEMTGREMAEALGRTYGAARQFLSEARAALSSIALRLCGALLP